MISGRSINPSLDSMASSPAPLVDTVQVTGLPPVTDMVVNSHTEGLCRQSHSFRCIIILQRHCQQNQILFPFGALNGMTVLKCGTSVLDSRNIQS